MSSGSRGPAEGWPPALRDVDRGPRQAPQVMFERFFHGLDLECGPASSAPPTDVEMRTVRHLPTPYWDLAALVGALAKRLKEKGPDRYFLYRVRRAGGVSYWLREDRISDATLFNIPGTTFELAATFPDLDSARRDGVAWSAASRRRGPRFPRRRHPRGRRFLAGHARIESQQA